jgi:site-specific DNA-methyltransferase (adenine-specific)
MPAMAAMKDQVFDLAITDPIYGISEPAFRKESKNKCAKNGIYKCLSYKQEKTGKEYFKELLRVSKNQIIGGGNYFIDHLYSTRCMIVWDKHTKETQWADAELAWTSFQTSVRICDYAWNGMIQGNMKNKEIRIHENQKPVALYQWLLKNYAKPGDKILDTHLGSGSSAIAADIMGYDFTGYEIDKDYYEAALDRFNRHKQQLVMDL